MQTLETLLKSPTFLIVLNLIVIFGVKVFDNILGTSKTILIQ